MNAVGEILGAGERPNDMRRAGASRRTGAPPTEEIQSAVAESKAASKISPRKPAKGLFTSDGTLALMKLRV